MAEEEEQEHPSNKNEQEQEQEQEQNLPPSSDPPLPFDPSRMVGIIKRKALIKDLAVAYHNECLHYCQELLELQTKWEEDIFISYPRELMEEKEESPLAKITRDSAKITVEQVHGLMSQVIKDILFNSVHQANKSRTETSDPEPMIES
ncbi:hypothetical protein MTR_8g006645 [Medicago truncatula]|uniref:Cop9 signalosome subunit 5 C-terminal domain-containing protein n=1 Tax=Medicago truncatula TaxID=3880 RepID=A0A072TJV3_MEDTR|nr:hypothetical protein MTR_8g006645 [Medicago truncatula]